MYRALRRVAGRGVDGLCGLVGRRQVVRLARFALHQSRLDLPNNPSRNGELALQRWVLAATPGTGPLTVVDVGAHVGNWSRSMLVLARQAGRRVDLHAFEPASDTHQLLAANLPTTARANRLAVSDQPGEQTLHVVGRATGRNSLHQHDGGYARAEPVVATTIDEYASSQALARIDLMKIDAEGHDFRVLRGAEQSFANQAVSVAQFEYNHRWVHSRQFLKDVFDLLGPLGYRIGKLTPRGVEWYPAWDSELETFVEGNYLACKARTAQLLPSIRWWKNGVVSCISA